jgi:tail tube protein
MTAVNKIDSNFTGLRMAVESAAGVLPGSPVWLALEPNSYDKFGGSIKTVARNPINDGRQRKKGVTVDLDAEAGFEIDITEDNTQVLMQSFLFAQPHTKIELAVPTVDATAGYEPASGGAAYAANDLVFGKGFTDAGNNGLKLVTGTPGASSVEFSGSVSAATQTGIISKVGHRCASGDATIDVSGALPRLLTTTLDLTTLGLTVGEWVCLGGDITANQFANAQNNGLKRVRAIATHSLTFDKSTNAMVTDAGTSKLIDIYIGRMLKNEIGSNIVRQTLQFERTLGAPDDSSPTDIQAEYITGCVANTLDLTIKTADKLTAKMAFLARDQETVTGVEGVKAGARPVLQESDAFNSSSHVVRLALNAIDPASASPAELFAFLLDMTLSIKNNVKANKAIKFLGSFDNSAGIFEVDAKMTAYFSTVDAIAQVRENSDVTLDMTFAQANKGVTLDMPLVTLATDGATVKQDEAIQLPITSAAATGSKLDVNLNHTLLVQYWDYLPSLAA